MDERTLIIALAVAVTAIVYVIVLAGRRRAKAAGSAASPTAGEREAPKDAGDVVRSVQVLRALRFFASESAHGDEALARKLTERIESEWGAPVAELAGTPAQLDALVALQDPQRAYRAPSKYFYPGEDSFLEIVAACGRLDGVAAFLPLREEWASQDGPVDVRFSVDGEESSCRISDPKYLDAGLFAALNAAAKDADRRLRVSDAMGMPDVVLALSDEEGATLTRERGWAFHPATR